MSHLLRKLNARAAGMAAATRGRKTRFASKAEVRARLGQADADAEVEEALTARRLDLRR